MSDPEVIESTTEAVPADQAQPETPAEVAGTPAENLDLGYRVTLDSFSGPLDLLLYLVRRAEVDITDIPVVEIADQFITTISAWEEADLDIAGDFILMATTLLELKARLIVPPELDDEVDDEDDPELVDPRADLIRKLLAYRRFKEATQVLEACERETLLVHARRFREVIPEAPESEDDVDLDNADAYALYAAWEKIERDIAGHRDRTVVVDDVPMDERVRQIEATMRTAREAQMAWLLSAAPNHVQRCGVFLAVLEGVRDRFLESSQHEQYGPVYLRYRDQEERRREAEAATRRFEREVEAAEAEAAEEDLTKDGKPRKRRRRLKLPLMTWQPVDGDLACDDGEQTELFTDEVEAQVETDEERFVRELNEATNVDRLLDDAKHLDNRLSDHLMSLGISVEIDGDGEGDGQGGGDDEHQPMAAEVPAAMSAEAPQPDPHGEHSES